MKKSYEKPEVKKVELRAEEAVLQNCKTLPDAGSTGCLDDLGNRLVLIGS